MHELNPHLTTWHITWGTYAARIHGHGRPTVDMTHSQFGDEFIGNNEDPEQSARGRMKLLSIILTRDQQRFIESIVPSTCDRGGWILRTCAAGPDHVHVLLEVDPKIHGEKVRRLLKRWIGQAMSERWPLQGGASWWAEEGSNRAVHHVYLNRAFPYVHGQRAAPETPCAHHGAEDGPARIA
jgi:REP element-mobilizing transposase RayT